MKATLTSEHDEVLKSSRKMEHQIIMKTFNEHATRPISPYQTKSRGVLLA